MIIKKITDGFVVQEWDTKQQKWISQEFVAGGQSEYENENGDSVDYTEMNPSGDEPYLPFEMVQPEE
jgi:hypothetical protein